MEAKDKYVTLLIGTRCNEARPATATSIATAGRKAPNSASGPVPLDAAPALCLL
jgi:hypothetical protein